MAETIFNSDICANGLRCNSFRPDIFFRQLLLPAVNVISSEDTPYGNITEADYKGEKSIYYNHRLIAYNSDATEREEDIHYAMLQREKPGKVIMISGALGIPLRGNIKISC